MASEPLPKRRSLRLKDFDYTSEGAYFITICTERRLELFGSMVHSRVQLTAAGRMIDAMWWQQESGAPGLRLDEWAVMPDHVHGILFLDARQYRRSVGEVIGAYKSVTTRAYARAVLEQGWQPFEGRLWQRGYHDHVVRDEQSLMRIREYIRSNPVRLDLEKASQAARAARGQTPGERGAQPKPVP